MVRFHQGALKPFSVSQKPENVSLQYDNPVRSGCTTPSLQYDNPRVIRALNLHPTYRMSCGCGKKKAGFNPILPSATGMVGAPISLEPANWGPCFWHFLHSFTERIGRTASPVVCHSQATIFRWIITNIPTILPCQACQAHAKDYILAHPIPSTFETLPGDALREQLRTWFFAFHTAVRERLGQPVLVTDVEACRVMYESETLNDSFIRDLSAYVIYAVRAGWVKLEAWKRWVTQYNRLKLAVGGSVT